MKSDVIIIDNRERGFFDAVEETNRIAEFCGQSAKDRIQLHMITEEMLSLVRSVTGEIEASFWLEYQDNVFELHMTTRTVMDKEKRYLLISSSTTRKNEAANSFLGRLRDELERAMASDVVTEYVEAPDNVQKDSFNWYENDPEWDRYELSILRNLADNIRIFIRGQQVHMIIRKKFTSPRSN